MLNGIGIGVPFTQTKGLGALIRGLFSNSEVGVWYDPSDFSTMFQDSAGTTPVTAVEQPVGLILDKSKGLVLGAELVTNGGFDSSTGWITDPLTSGVSWVVSGGVASVTSTASATDIFQAKTVTNNTSYLLEFDVVSLSGAGVEAFARKAGTTLSASVLFTTTGRKRLVVLTNATTIYPSFRVNVGSAVIDNVTLRELPGNHATQVTSTARPVLRAGLDFDGVDDKMVEIAGGGSTTQFFMCAGIKPEGGAGAVRVLWSDAGTNTGYIVRLNASNQLELAAGNATSYTTIATVATLSVGTAYVVTVWDDGTNLNVQVNSGAVASVARPVVAAGTATASIGSDNGAATGWFNGLIYSLIQVKNDAGTDAERASAKSYVASKSGVTL